MPATSFPSADVVLGDLGTLLLDSGVSVTDIRGTLKWAGAIVAAGEDLEFAVLPQPCSPPSPWEPWLRSSAS